MNGSEKHKENSVTSKNVLFYGHPCIKNSKISKNLGIWQTEKNESFRRSWFPEKTFSVRWHAWRKLSPWVILKLKSLQILHFDKIIKNFMFSRNYGKLFTLRKLTYLPYVEKVSVPWTVLWSGRSRPTA